MLLTDTKPLTTKDLADLDFALEQGVDGVALSFVQRASDVIEAKALIKGRAFVLSKIEKPAALDDIDDIIAASDAIMIARGDLGVELPAGGAISPKASASQMSPSWQAGGGRNSNA